VGRSRWHESQASLNAGVATVGTSEEETEGPSLRVAFYCDSGVIGGAEMSLANLVSTVAPRIEAIIIGTNERVVTWLASHRDTAARVVLPPIGRKRKIRAIAAHHRTLRRLRPDVLHVSLNCPWASHWAILSGLSISGIQVVAVEQLPQRIPRLRQRLLKRLTAPRLAGHVAVGSADAVARLCHVSRSSVRTIFNAVPEFEIAPLPRRSVGPVVGSLGRIELQKGFDVLVRTLPELPGVTAVVVGDGSERTRVIELAEDLGVADRLVLPGWSNEARRHLTTFDVFVLPSRFEGLSLAVLEAMHAGLAVVATDVDGMSEAVIHGETGLLVPVDDADALAAAIRRLLDHPERAREMGARGRELARERFSVAAMAKAYEALYDEVVRSPRGEPTHVSWSEHAS
jgi:glycosyltransferase involved in cell wall biosynthesis